MGKYLKEFENHSSYNQFTQTEDFILPNVSHCDLQNDVHYNPSGIKVSGKITVPSRLLEIQGGSDEIQPARSNLLRGTQYNYDCYGLNKGLVQDNPTITYNDQNNIPLKYLTEYTETGTITDSVDGKEYRIIKFKLEYIPVDASGNPFSNFSEQYNGQTYYYDSVLPDQSYIYGRLDSNGILQIGQYDQGENDNLIFTQTPFIKSTIQSLNVCHSVYNSSTGQYTTVYETIDINTIRCTQGEEVYEYTPLETEVYNGDLIFEEGIQHYMIIPFPNYPSATALKNIFMSIKIDNQELDLDNLFNENGFVTLENGEHSIEYRLNPTGFDGYLQPKLFEGVPIENLRLDKRIRGIYYQYSDSDWHTAFDSCALLGTDEETIKRIFNLKPFDPSNETLLEPIIFECEFGNESNKLSSGNVFDFMYFAIFNDVVGMHSCVNESGGGGLA